MDAVSEHEALTATNRRSRIAKLHVRLNVMPTYLFIASRLRRVPRALVVYPGTTEFVGFFENPTEGALSAVGWTGDDRPQAETVGSATSARGGDRMWRSDRGRPGAVPQGEAAGCAGAYRLVLPLLFLLRSLSAVYQPPF